MKIYTLLATLLFTAGSLHAATLDCKSVLNTDTVAQGAVVTQVHSKTLIQELPEITSYVTELRTDFFSIEAYISDLGIRIYSEGSLKETGETLTATVWSRELLVDVICKKLK